MKNKIRVFIDTNIIFSFWRSYTRSGFVLSYTDFGSDTSIDLMISTHVVYELIIVCKRNDIMWDDDRFADMLEVLHISYRDGSGDYHIMLDLVHDPKDAQIVADAQSLQCNYLLTKNHRDFKANSIKQKHQITIIGSLREIQL